MKIDYCKLAEDLLPLYADNLISPETKEFLDWHLSKCPECTNKYLGAVAALKEDQSLKSLPEEARYESARRFLLTLRRKTKGIAALLLVLFIVFSLTSFWLGQASFSEKPLKVKSPDEYAAKVVPGWSRAERCAQIVQLGITRPIEGTQAEVTFEKVWFNQRYTVVLYTVKDPEGKYYQALGEGLDLSPDNRMANNPGMHPFGNRFGGISADGIHNIMVFLGYDASVAETNPDLILSIPQWSQGPFPPNNYSSPKEINSEISISLKLKKEYLIEKVETVALNKSLEWKGRKVTLDKLEVGFSRNVLSGKVKLPPGESSPSLQGYFQVGNQQAYFVEQKTEPSTESDTYNFIAYSSPFNEWPAPVELQLDGLSFKTSEIIAFPFTWSKYKEVLERKLIETGDQAPRESYDSTIRLWSIDQDGLSFKIDKRSVKKQAIVIEPEMTGKLQILNENSQQLPFHSGGSWSGQIFGNEDIGFGFEIDRTAPFWQTSNQITLKLINPIARMILNEKIPINP